MEKIKTPKIKICGITSEREAEYLNEAGADYAGFVFYEKSKRNVSERQALRIMGRLEKSIGKIAVAVSPALEFAKRAKEMGFDFLQIHGICEREVLEYAPLPIWRAVNITDQNALTLFFEREADVSAKNIKGCVMDGAGYGGGEAFDWEGLALAVRGYADGRELVLAGGLREENVKEGIRLFRPDVVDVSSGVEEGGKKSREKINNFIRKVREDGQ